MKIKDWFYAIGVCKKYGLKWNPLCKIGDGSYSYEGVIKVNPFDPDFLTIFLHEVGHHVHDKKVLLRHYMIAYPNELRFANGQLCGCSVYRVLEAEATASRFAAKTGKADRNYLVSAFNTYSANIFKHTTNTAVVNEISDIIDCVYKNSRRIEK